MNLLRLSVIASALVLRFCAALPAQDKPILHTTFEDGLQGWAAMGVGGKSDLCYDAPNIHSGKASLRYDYEVKKNSMSFLILPTSDGVLAKAKSIQFWIKADYDAKLVVSLQKAGGGRFLAFFTAPSKIWQNVELSVKDFSLSEEATDPKDPTGKLVMEQVESITITDLGQLIQQGSDELAKLLGIQSGNHSLYLDDFVAQSASLAPAFVEGDEVIIDQYLRPQLSWITTGGMKLSLAASGPLTGKNLLADYKQDRAQFSGLIHRMSKGLLAGTGKLTFKIASAKPMKFMVQVEEVGGGKWNTMIDVAGDKVVKEVKVKLADFTQGMDSKDANGKLDIDQVTQVILVDLSGMIDGADGLNQFWISPIIFSSAK